MGQRLGAWDKGKPGQSQSIVLWIQLSIDSDSDTHTEGKVHDHDSAMQLGILDMWLDRVQGVLDELTSAGQ